MNEIHLLFSFVIGVSLLIFLILRTKVHVFPSLIISSAVIGLISGLPPSQTVSAITSGFGNTLASIGIVIGLGVMLGKLLEVSGAAEKMADIFIKSVGSGKENWALALTGAVVSISVFCDSGFVILISLAKSISKKSKFVFATLSISLASGLVVTHHCVPPTPGPLAVAGLFGVDVGVMIIFGLIVSIPIIISMVLYSKYSGEKINISVNNSFEQEKEEKSIPPASISFLPIIIPIILILSKTILDTLKVSGIIMGIFDFVGSPVIAILLGLLIAIGGLARNFSLSETSKFIEKSLSAAGVIILITGAGGSLGNILRVSGVGSYIADIAVSPKFSRTEWNGKLLYYMAMGVPVVVFDTPVNREILGDLGVYAKLNDSISFAQEIENLLLQDELRRSLGEKLRERVVNNYSWKKAGERIMKIYEEVLKRKKD